MSLSRVVGLFFAKKPYNNDLGMPPKTTLLPEKIRPAAVVLQLPLYKAKSILHRSNEPCTSMTIENVVLRQ